MIGSDIENMVNEDLEKCNLLRKIYLGLEPNEQELENMKKLMPNEEDVISVFVGLNARYSSLIRDFPKDIDYRSLDEDDEEDELIIYLTNVIEKLKAFQRNGYKEERQNNSAGIVINNHNENHNNNHNDNDVTIKILSFQEARQTIENMSALKDEDIETALNKINELEKIINSNDRKSKKWENAKGIAKWAVEQGLDVLKVVIPILLKIN